MLLLLRTATSFLLVLSSAASFVTASPLAPPSAPGVVSRPQRPAENLGLTTSEAARNVESRAVDFINKASPSQLTQEQIDGYTPLIKFARAVSCDVSKIATWSCGTNCEGELPGFKVYGAGGDGDLTPFWFVGYDPTFTNSIIVSHQGTNFTKFLSVLNDAEFLLVPLDSNNFPGAPPLTFVHAGFQLTHARSAKSIVTAILKAQLATGSTHVTITAHSLGGAVALLDALYLPLNLPSSTTFTTVTYGGPRVGNAVFANYVDSKVTNLSRVVNKKDIVPAIPPTFLLYQHASSEKHINAPSNTGSTQDWSACPGQENFSNQCLNGVAPTLFMNDANDHEGPYNGIFLGQKGKVGCDA